MQLYIIKEGTNFSNEFSIKEGKTCSLLLCAKELISSDALIFLRRNGGEAKLAGFREVGETKGGLLALQLLPENMPEPEAAKEARNGTP